MNKSRSHRCTKRCGFSLVEMITASALVAGTLVPALSIMRESMALSREANLHSLLANYAVLKLEEQSSIAMRYWQNVSDEGNFSSDGRSDLGFYVVQSDLPVNGGLENRLMNIEVTVFEDLDGDELPDVNELQVKFRTKVSKLFSYENEPT